MRYLIGFIMILMLINLKPTNLSEISKVVNETIIVEVKGHLNNPGIFEIKTFSTFNDLLKVLNLYEDSDISNYSLNKRLINDDLIVINKMNEIKKISINSASIDELITLNGIGEVIAKRIIDYRENVKSFNDLEDLKNVKGIGDKLFSKIKDFITL